MTSPNDPYFLPFPYNASPLKNAAAAARQHAYRDVGEGAGKSDAAGREIPPMASRSGLPGSVVQGAEATMHTQLASDSPAPGPSSVEGCSEGRGRTPTGERRKILGCGPRDVWTIVFGDVDHHAAGWGAELAVDLALGLAQLISGVFGYRAHKLIALLNIVAGTLRLLTPHLTLHGQRFSAAVVMRHAPVESGLDIGFVLACGAARTAVVVAAAAIVLSPAFTPRSALAGFTLLWVLGELCVRAVRWSAFASHGAQSELLVAAAALAHRHAPETRAWRRELGEAGGAGEEELYAGAGSALGRSRPHRRADSQPMIADLLGGAASEGLLGPAPSPHLLAVLNAVARWDASVLVVENIAQVGANLALVWFVLRPALPLAAWAPALRGVALVAALVIIGHAILLARLALRCVIGLAAGRTAAALDGYPTEYASRERAGEPGIVRVNDPPGDAA